VIDILVKWAQSKSGDWDTPANWLGGQVPGPADTPVFGWSKAYTATLSSNHTIDDLDIRSSSVTVEIGNGATLTLAGNRIYNAGTIAIDTALGPAQLLIEAGARLVGAGQVILGSSTAAIVSGGAPEVLVNVDNTIKGTGTIGDSNMTLTNKGTIDATGQLTINTGSNAVTNTGTLEAIGTGARLQLASALINSSTGGLLADGGGELDVFASSKGGSATISGIGSILDLGGSSTAVTTTTNAVFASGASGTLDLDHSSLFAGTVAGFASGDTIDVLDVGFAPKRDSYDPNTGILRVSDGTHVANIHLLGTYMASQFVFQDDMHGGTQITEVPPASASVLAAAHT
jgi:hypothetical protein